MAANASGRATSALAKSGGRTMRLVNAEKSLCATQSMATVLGLNHGMTGIWRAAGTSCCGATGIW